MAAFLDNCRFIPTAGGTADWVYSSSVGGCQSPAAAGAVDGRKYKFLAISSDLTQWEIAEGVYTASSGTFARTTILYNSAGTGAAAGQSGAGSKISFTAAPNVAIVGIKEDLISIEEANSFTAAQQAQARANVGAAEIGTGLGLSNVSFAVSASSGNLTIALKTAAGNDPSAADPIALNFRNVTQGSGPLSQLLITAATNITVFSGRTLGFANATAARLWITGWNDAGTFRLGVFNASDATAIYPLDETSIASAVDLVGGANSAGVHYTQGAAVVNKAFRILGYVDWNSGGVASAGTWTVTNLNSIQTFGPGIRKPGDIIQERMTTIGSGSSTSTTSGSYVSTSLTQSPTLRSAANLVDVQTVGSGLHNTSGIGIWSRILETVSSTQIGSETLSQNNANAGVFPVVVHGIGKPNTTSPTFTMQIRSQSGGNTVSYAQFGTAVMIFREIMG